MPKAIIDRKGKNYKIIRKKINIQRMPHNMRNKNNMATFIETNFFTWILYTTYLYIRYLLINTLTLLIQVWLIH
jgi:hypothetical protein